MITGRFCGTLARGTPSTGTYCPISDIRSAARVPGRGGLMIVSSSGQITPETVHDHEMRNCPLALGGVELLGLGGAGQGDRLGLGGDRRGHPVEVTGADFALVAGGGVAGLLGG